MMESLIKKLRDFVIETCSIDDHLWIYIGTNLRLKISALDSQVLHKGIIRFVDVTFFSLATSCY